MFETVVKLGACASRFGFFLQRFRKGIPSFWRGHHQNLALSPMNTAKNRSSNGPTDRKVVIGKSTVIVVVVVVVVVVEVVVVVVLRGTIVDRTYGIHKNYILNHFYPQYLVLFIMFPRNSGRRCSSTFEASEC